MTSRVLAKLAPLAALLGLPSDTSKQYAYRPATGWEEIAGGSVADIPQQLIDGRWRYTTAEQDLGAGYDLAVFFPTAVNTAISTAFNGALAEGAGWETVGGGAGAGATRANANAAILFLNTGTTATGQCALGYKRTLGNNIWENDNSGAPASFARPDLTGFSGRGVLLLDSLSTAAQEYVVMMDVGPEAWAFTSNPSSLGLVQLMYQRTASANWRIRYCDTSGTVKYLDTGIAVAASTIYRVSIKGIKQPDNTYTISIDINGSTFSITDSYLNTSGWRAGAAITRVLTVPTVTLVKTAGTTSAALQVRLFAFSFAH
jgi:hypothetical protein